MKKFLLILICLFSISYGQEYFKWRWSESPITQNPDASGLHFVGSYTLAGSFDNSMPWWGSDLATLGLGTVWEIKDALIPWELIGFIGGEGFSWGDFYCDTGGIVLHRLGVLAFNRIKYRKWELNSIKKKISALSLVLSNDRKGVGITFVL
ncbi:MAG: hypothetical protein ABII90_07295 [Bacteroidota bacterium]